MEQEINIARDMQQALLPRIFRDYPHLSVSGINFPCLSVGGDYFDVFPLGDTRTAFLIADVSGKGLGAALLATLLQGALSGMTLGTDPARAFSHINRFLCDHAEVGRYATMFFGILDEQGHLEYINAGHPSPFLIRRGVAEDVFTEGSYPVGLVPEARARRHSCAVQRWRHRGYGSRRATFRCPAPSRCTYRPHADATRGAPANRPAVGGEFRARREPGGRPHATAVSLPLSRDHHEPHPADTGRFRKRSIALF